MAGTYQNNQLQFTLQPMGYDKTQVDGYVSRMSREYQNLLGQYELVSKENASHPQSSETANMEAIAKALVDAQTKSMEIIASAKAEASRIVDGAYTDYAKIEREKARLTTEINNLINGLKGFVTYHL